jgi:ornithine cyclodeaminase/alanine dehydrogenase-like protein (mu-crystallin family)
MARRPAVAMSEAEVAMLDAILRVHPEPYSYLDERTVHAALSADPVQYLAFLETEVTRAAQGRMSLDLPPKQLFTDPATEGDFRVMPCVTRSDAGTLKTVKLVGTNTAQLQVPDQITVGKAFCLHPVENYVTHVIEACLLSSARTGACAAIVAGRLAPSRRKVTIIGAGRVGFYAALYLANLEGVEEFVVYDREPGRSAALAEAVERITSRAVRCRVATDGPESADVVILATTSNAPILAAQEVTAGLVVSLGADTLSQRELHSSWAEAGDVYVDSLDSTEVGDLRAWLAEGVITRDRLVDLLGLFRKAARRDSRPTQIFISTGSALLDNLTIAYLLRHEVE